MIRGLLGEASEEDPAAVAEFIRTQRAEYGIPQRVSCQAPRVSESRFHK